MNKKILTLFFAEEFYHTVFKNNHGRLIYLAVSFNEGNCQILKCFYLDRSKTAYPKKLVTRNFNSYQLLSVIATELDRTFEKYILNNECSVSKQKLISEAMASSKKNILILVGEGNYLATIFKNKYYRTISLKMIVEGGSVLISECYYCDNRAKSKFVSPYGLKSIRFKYSKENILEIINTELEGGFSDVVISYDHTLELTEPICGSV